MSFQAFSKHLVGPGFLFISSGFFLDSVQTGRGEGRSVCEKNDGYNIFVVRLERNKWSGVDLRRKSEVCEARQLGSWEEAPHPHWEQSLSASCSWMSFLRIVTGQPLTKATDDGMYDRVQS